MEQLLQIYALLLKTALNTTKQPRFSGRGDVSRPLSRVATARSPDVAENHSRYEHGKLRWHVTKRGSSPRTKTVCFGFKTELLAQGLAGD